MIMSATTQVSSPNETSVRDRPGIQEFFNGTSVFITGGTGFLGSVLLEKLIRCCPGIKKVYLLVRPKKGKEITERFNEIFDSPIFERMKKEVPAYLERVAAISGDCMLPMCGVSSKDQELMKREINVVFHVAATVRFDAKMRFAVNINIRATRDLLTLSRQFDNLKAFVHISTAYSNCLNRVIQECFYDPPFSGSAAISLAEKFDDDMLEKMTPALLGSWPNSYALTKCIAEEVVREMGKGLPVAVVRPSIVIATAKDPLPGWINNYYGPTGVVAGAGVGLLRTLHADGDCVADIVPVDYVINAIIAAGWDIGLSFKPREDPLTRKSSDLEKLLQIPDIAKTADETSELEVTEQTLLEDLTPGKKQDSSIPVYNFVSSNQNKLTWRKYMDLSAVAAPEVPSKMAVWTYSLTLNKYKYIDLLYAFFLHMIPALIVDGCSMLIGKKPRLLQAYKKIHNFSSVISYFSTKEWKFEDDNVAQLWNKLNDKDKDVFFFSLKNLDWKEYFYHYIRGIRVYLIRDPLESIPEGQKKRLKFMIAHYALVSLFYLLCSYVLYIALQSAQSSMMRHLVQSS
ncbi:fatty acyl-CoA reductase wat [Bemisia tabaci]